MKRFGNLYPKIFDMDNIRLAHHNARKGKSSYKEVQVVDATPEFYFEQIHNILKNKTFKNAKYHVFKRSFNGKEREIFKLPYFPDRIIHHCVMQILEPIWKKSLIRDTYSSIKGRGIHDGVRRVKKALTDKENTGYCLKLDVKKFYPSVDHGVLKDIIRRKIKCKDTLWLLDTIIDSTAGIPIGNYLSQYFGNIYLSILDHVIKETCHIKYYFRYCDDLVLLAKSKEELWQAFSVIQQQCALLKLSVKRNYQVFPIERGIDFLGYRFFRGYTLLRRNIASQFKKKILSVKGNWRTLQDTKIVNGVMSYYGWIKHANCQRLFIKYIDKEIKGIVSVSCLKLKQSNPLRRILYERAV